MPLIRTALAAAALGIVSFAGAHAQIGEQRIRIVMPYAAGGVGDATGRMIAEAMRAALNRPVIFENRVGAGGRLGVQAVKDAPADGSVLLFTPIAPMAVFEHVYDKLGYDPVGDFAPISQVAAFDLGVAVGPSVPAKTLKELVDWLRANPSQGTYGIPAAGSLPHFFGMLFGRKAVLDLRHVAYKGSGPAITDLIGGHLPIYFSSIEALVETHKAGRIRILATSGQERYFALPEVPTFVESGFDIRGSGWFAMYAPAQTPPEIIARLNTVVVAAIRAPELRSRLMAVGLQPTGTSASELAKIQKSDSDLWGPVIKASGFKPESE
jgi:tripartite-type tricarboxylate transporter receptor subunit TctC